MPTSTTTSVPAARALARLGSTCVLALVRIPVVIGVVISILALRSAGG
jgi:hypothetical protein